jgi:HJR/Mrr/RecB family endonuclease
MIRNLSREEFENFDIVKEPMALLIAKEEKWFCNDNENLLGIILKDNFDKDYGYIILSPGEDDAFRSIKTMVSYETIQEAEDVLISLMRKISSEGKSEEIFFTVDEDTIHDSKIALTDINEEVKKFLKKHPEKLYQLSPRKFEELIASIMNDLGFDVELTKATKDGGKDIIATIRNSVTSFLAYIECKKYAPENRIGVEIIRNVLGVQYLRKPSKSIIITTSFFTEEAKEECRNFENQLDLKDFNNIKEWLNRY